LADPSLPLFGASHLAAPIDGRADCGRPVGAQVHKFRFAPFNSDADSWPVYEDALLAAMDMAGIVDPLDRKRALCIILDSKMRESLAAGLTPRRITDPTVTFEEMILFFRRRFDSDYTHNMAAYDFLHSRQGSLSLDEWVERLHKLAAKANLGAALDQLLLCHLLTGVADQRCRQELIRQEGRTSREAIQFVRRYLKSVMDSDYVGGASSDAARGLPWGPLGPYPR